MQLITAKTLPPLPLSLVNLLEKGNGKGVRQVQLELRLRYCPSMDLVATYPVLIHNQDVEEHSEDGSTAQADPYATDDEEAISVDVWRLNGQKVFEVNVETDEGSRLDIIDVQWRDDGQILAVLSSDNVVRLINSYSGKTIHRFSSLSTIISHQSPRLSMSTSLQTKHTTRTKSKSITLSYSIRFANPVLTSVQLEFVDRQNGTVLDDLLSLNADIGKLLQSQPDLPKNLASIDVEAFLPKLACLPPAGFGVDDVFSTRTSIDAIFHASKRSMSSGTVDVLAIGTNNGTMNLRFFDAFEVGDIDLLTATGLPKEAVCGPVRYIINHPLSSTCLVISEFSVPKRSNRLYLLNLDLKAITRSTTTLPILATKAAQLRNLLRYLKQIQTQLVREVKAAFDLPSRFLSNLKEDLEKQDGEGSTFINTAYHTIVTGETSPAFKEWLSDQLGERGVKRWEKAVGDCLELIRRLIGENWNPAVERMGIVVSQLAGLGTWSSHGKRKESTLGFEKKVVESMKETINVMTICGEELLRDVNQELAGFTSFVKWLKWEVEGAALEDTSQQLDEMRESGDQTDVLHVLEYIKNGPANTVVKKYIGPALEQPPMVDEEDVGFYDKFKETRKRSSEHMQVFTFDVLLARTNRLCERLFEQVAFNLRKSVMVEYMNQLPSNLDRQVMAVRLIQEPEYGQPKVHIIGRSTDVKGDLLHAIVEANTRGQQQIHGAPTAHRLLQLPDAEDVLDIKFVDDSSFIVLAAAPGQIQLYTHNLTSDVQDQEGFELRHVFEQGMMSSGMRPSRLEVNGRRGRRAVAVIDEKGKGYCVFDLDSGDATELDAIDDDDLMRE